MRSLAWHDTETNQTFLDWVMDTCDRLLADGLHHQEDEKPVQGGAPPSAPGIKS